MNTDFFKGNMKIAIALLVVAFLAGMGGYFLLHKSAPAKVAEATPTPAPTPQVIQIGTGSTKLIFATHWSSFQLDGVYDNGVLKSNGLKQYLEEYTKLHPEISFDVQSINFAEYFEKLKILNDTGLAPDLYEVNSQWAAPYIAKGMLDMPPTDVVADINKNYTSTAGVTVNGQVWGYPTEIDDYVLLYNKRMFQEAGITTPPTTWNELVADAVKTTKKENGQVTQYGYATSKDDWELTIDPFFALVYSNGGAFVTPDFKKTLINSPEAVQVLTAETQLFKLGASDISASFYDFPKEKVAMVIAPPWIKNNFKKGLGDKFNTEVGLAPLPGFKKQTTLQYGWFTGVMKNGKHTKEAWNFLQWFASDVQPKTNTTRLGDLLANTIGAIPARKVDQQNEVALQDFFTSFYIKQLSNAVASPILNDYDVMRKQLMSQVQAAWTGDKTPQAALDDAAKSINQVLSTYYK